MEKEQQKYYTYIAFTEDDALRDIGVTIDLNRRFRLLNQLYCKAETQCCKLVYFEEFIDSLEATYRESEIMDLSRKTLREMVESTNPMFVDLLKVQSPDL